ncbi:fatty acid desaturase [Spirulina subsalsa]|uniref:fatty acid desaturase n=1 Tax=Spirulina subsalsa TaxID=54311 RepID=UPI0002DCB99F|nr:fatty acid desaturase [Spirulina subsalsa]
MTATTEKFVQTLVSPDLTTLHLKDILKTLPRQCFEKNRRKAWTSVVISLCAALVGYIGIIALPWYCLPLTWIWTGTALTGWFVIGHDCGHRSFAQRRWVNDLVGHFFMMPLIYPFHSWRILHNQHHAHTNKLEFDNAWEPWTESDYQAKPWLVRVFYRAIRGRLWWIGSIAHWGLMHFKLDNFQARDQGKVKLSIAVVLLFAAIAFPLLLITTGPWGFVKFWLMPWLVYHFWMSTFTIVHHTIPEIHFKTPQDWHEVEAQLAGTVHCTYPRWVEFLCHDINVHVPHHLSVAIPSYNLRLAHESLTTHWGSAIKTRQFSWELMDTISRQCHLYDPDKGYRPFK